jgi:hypothetical protein
MYRIALWARTLEYLTGGGHFWAYLNWAIGLKEAGCQVVWTESYADNVSVGELMSSAHRLRARLAPYGLGKDIALVPWSDEACFRSVPGCLDPADVTDCDLVLDLAYALRPRLARLCQRTALVDIDPGLLQLWIKNGNIRVAAYDAYFTIGQNIGGPDSAVPDLGLNWRHTPPCVALDQWCPALSLPGARFTTITQWWEAWMANNGEASPNDKRAGFQPYLDLPQVTQAPLELAVNLGPDSGERSELERRGWSVRDPAEVAGTPEAYRSYIRASRGEFSCAKPWYVRLKTGWISDRTLCYLASAKPAVVQYTGPSKSCTGHEGLLRFRTPREAAQLLDAVVDRYDEHAEAARALAEAHFDARKVVACVLDQALHRASKRRHAPTNALVPRSAATH